MTHIATRKQFTRNLASGWFLLIAEVTVAFLLTPFIIGKLGAAAYGIWALMISVIGYMGLVDVGIRGSVGRYVNHYLALKDYKALGEVVGTANVVLTLLATCAFAASFAVAVHFATIFPKTPPELIGAIKFCLPLLAVGLWLSFVTSILANLLIAREALYLTNQFALYTLALRSAATFWVLSAGFGIEALVLVNLGSGTIGLLISLWAVLKVFKGEVPRMVGFSGSRLAEIWRFGIASFTGRTASTMANDSAPIIGMWVLGPEAVAVYSVAMTLAQYSRRVIDQAGGAIFGSVMKAGAMKDFGGLQLIYIRFMDISFAIGSLVFIGLLIFSHSFLGLWVGPDYQAGAIVVAILTFGYLLQGIASTASFTLASLDKVMLIMKIGIGEALACVALTALLPGVFGLGLAGMALGATLPRLVSNCLIYPSLAIASMGAELRPLMRRAVIRNLMLCCGVAAAFTVIYFLIPSNTWPGLVTASAAATILHFAVMGGRYKLAATDRLRAGIQAMVQRFGKKFNDS